MPWQKAEAIQTTLNWGGLSELPENSEIISIKTHGSMFTRSFTLEFSSTKQDISNWINESRGLSSLIPTGSDSQVLTYEIYPGEYGAVGGTVQIDRNNKIVVIHMSWS